MSIHSSNVWIVDGLVRFATFHDDPGMHERRSHVHVTGQCKGGYRNNKKGGAKRGVRKIF